MDKTIISEGKCLYCDEKFSQKGIAKHLARHLSAIEKEKPSEKERGYHLSIEAGNMFLQALVKEARGFRYWMHF